MPVGLELPVPACRSTSVHALACAPWPCCLTSTPPSALPHPPIRHHCAGVQGLSRFRMSTRTSLPSSSSRPSSIRCPGGRPRCCCRASGIPTRLHDGNFLLRGRGGGNGTARLELQFPEVHLHQAECKPVNSHTNIRKYRKYLPFNHSKSLSTQGPGREGWNFRPLRKLKAEPVTSVHISTVNGQPVLRPNNRPDLLHRAL